MTVNSADTGMLAWGVLIGTAEDDCRDQAAAENPADTHAVSDRPRNMASIMPAAKLQNRSNLSVTSSLALINATLVHLEIYNNNGCL